MTDICNKHMITDKTIALSFIKAVQLTKSNSRLSINKYMGSIYSKIEFCDMSKYGATKEVRVANFIPVYYHTDNEIVRLYETIIDESSDISLLFKCKNGGGFK